MIGAFALSNNIFIIALGLGIGAMFVRSMTVMLVDKGTLSEYRYLEHGAFWAIMALATVGAIALLRQASQLAAERNFQVVNADVTVVCERPKIAPHAAEMCARLADALGGRFDARMMSVKQVRSDVSRFGINPAADSGKKSD